MTALGALLVHRPIPQGEAAIRIPAAAIKGSALFGASFCQESGTTLLGAGYADTERVGEIAFRIRRTG